MFLNAITKDITVRLNFPLLQISRNRDDFFILILNPETVLNRLIKFKLFVDSFGFPI